MDDTKSIAQKFFWGSVGAIVGLIALLLLVEFTNASSEYLTPLKQLGESLKPLVEVMAILVAGLWTYRLFIKNRTEFPYAELEQSASHWKLESNHLYLVVFVRIKNRGKVLLDLESGNISIQRIKPVSDDLMQLITNADFDELNNGYNGPPKLYQ